MSRIKQEDKEIIEIKPIIFGGNPTDINNKKKVSRTVHIEYVRYWNSIMLKIKEGKSI